MRLLYIGKSSKDFTNNKIYNFYGNFVKYDDIIHIDYSVYNNKGKIIKFNNNRIFLEENFKFIDQKEYLNYLRKNKLNELNNKQP